MNGALDLRSVLFYLFYCIFVARRIKNRRHKQTVRMEKIKIFNGDGKTRDERETCFPSMYRNSERPNHVRDEQGGGL